MILEAPSVHALPKFDDQLAQLGRLVERQKVAAAAHGFHNHTRNLRIRACALEATRPVLVAPYDEDGFVIDL